MKGGQDRSGFAGIDARKSAGKLAVRWDALAAKARGLEWGRVGLIELASRCGLAWYPGRGNEPLAWFLKRDGDQLVRLRGFGRKKIGLLFEIVSNALELRAGEFPAEEIAEEPDPRTALLAWEVPEDFPCRLCLFPARVMSYCEKQGLVGIGQLLDEWLRLGFDGFKDQRNLGTKSVRQVEAWVHALRCRDHQAASSFLPLVPSGSGLSLSQALTLVGRLPTPSERPMLQRRLVERMTLEESAEVAGVTRERVRQIEVGFLGEIRDRLDYFRQDRNELLDAWIAGGDWFATLRPVEHEELVKGAIEAIFDETPQAVARVLGEEAKWDAWSEELRMHPDLWFGGLVLDEFLVERVPIPARAGFCERLAALRELRLDHGDGKVYPAKTALYPTVAAILAREDDPVPLTWLVELLRATGYHPNITRDIVKAQGRRWLMRPEFPGDKILWHQ